MLVFIEITELLTLLALVEDKSEFVLLESIVSKKIFSLGWPFYRRREQGVKTYSECGHIYLKRLSTRGMSILVRSGHDCSRLGLVLTSIKYTFKFSSSMKSRPKSSKLCYLLSGSNRLYVALIVSVAISFILGKICS